MLSAPNFQKMTNVVSPDLLSNSNQIELGARLKMVREQNGLSQRELAKRSGLTHSTISLIEQGQTSPSINSLEKILSGIPLTLAQFFLSSPNSSSQVVFRSSERKSRPKPQLGCDVQDIPHKSSHALIALQKIILLGGADMGAIPQISPRAVTGFVIAGELELTADFHVSLLNVDDAFSLSAHQPYRLRNLSLVEPCILLICEA